MASPSPGDAGQSYRDTTCTRQLWLQKPEKQVMGGGAEIGTLRTAGGGGRQPGLLSKFTEVPSDLRLHFWVRSRRTENQRTLIPEGSQQHDSQQPEGEAACVHQQTVDSKTDVQTRARYTAVEASGGSSGTRSGREGPGRAAQGKKASQRTDPVRSTHVRSLEPSHS